MATILKNMIESVDFNSNVPVATNYSNFDVAPSYVSYFNNIPLLTAEEEYELAMRFRKFGDLEAAKKLVLAHVRFVIKIVRSYLGYGLPASDLIQEGNIGLMKAVKHFDPEKGIRFVSFAVHWIKAEINEYILKNWKLVKVATTKAQRKLFFHLRKFLGKTNALPEKEIKNISEEYHVPAYEVRTMEEKLTAHDVSCDVDENNDDDERKGTCLYLEDKSADPQNAFLANNSEEFQNKSVNDAVALLDDRSYDIVKNRWLVEDENKKTLEELAHKYNISLERVRQIEKKALEKIKKNLQNRGIEDV